MSFSKCSVNKIKRARIKEKFQIGLQLLEELESTEKEIFMEMMNSLGKSLRNSDCTGEKEMSESEVQEYLSKRSMLQNDSLGYQKELLFVVKLLANLVEELVQEDSTIVGVQDLPTNICDKRMAMETLKRNLDKHKSNLTVKKLSILSNMIEAMTC